MQTALHPALDYLARLVRQGGPTVADHALLDFHFGQLAEDLARDGMLNLTYEDDGRGVDAARPTEGIGLRNMRERVEELGGELHLDAVTGRGTSVVIDLPLTP